MMPGPPARLGVPIPEFAHVFRAGPPGRHPNAVAAPGGLAPRSGLSSPCPGIGALTDQRGYAMAALPSGTTVPWHRVINAAGMVSRRKMPGAELTQRQLLEKEGIRFDARGRVALERVRWRPRTNALSGVRR